MEISVVWLLSVVSVLVVTPTDAAVRVSARERLARFHGNLPRHVRYRRSAGSLSDIFGLVEGESLEIKAEATTAQGTKLYKMVEKFHGKNIFDTVVTMTTDGKIPFDAHGYIVQDIQKDIHHSDKSLSKDELFDILIRHFKDEKHIMDIGSRKLRRDFYVDSDNVAHRVAIVDYLIQKQGLTKRPTAIINVKTGEVIRAWDNLTTCKRYQRRGRLYGGNHKIGNIKYGVKPKCLQMRRRRGMCYLENKYVKIVDMFNSEHDYITETARFNCFGRYNDRINGAYSPALDALYHGTVVGKMFADWFNAKPLKRKMILRVHYSHHFTNAFWNGHNCSFGDGIPGVSYPFTSLDIIGHEIAHGITEQNSRLMYIGEAGAINEAFSDITGEMAELYADTVDWRVGYAIKVDGSMRYFGNPEKDNTSISHVSHYRENMNTHDTSGIFNYVFYLLAHEYSYNPQDIYRVFLHANRMYWHPMTNFKTGACDIMLSAYDLGQPGEPFSRAFKEVGIEVCDIDDHVLHLRHNVTLVNVTVSNTTKPVFAMAVPDWSDTIYVQAYSYDADIYIRMHHDGWAQINESTPTMLEGFHKLYYKLARYHSDTKVYIKLTTSSPNPLKDVKVRGGYTCVDHFHTYNYKHKEYFYWECLGIDIESRH